MMEGNLVCDRIFVDTWVPQEHKNYAYFLATFQPEFREVLNSSWTSPIYSSELNIQTLKSFTEVKHDLLRPLCFNTKAFISLEDYNFYAVPIDSESVSGSVIYHFICPSGEFLYMGKVRLSPQIMKNPYITELGKNGTINGIYVDTTLLSTMSNFTLEQAADLVMKTLRYYSDLKFVMALPLSGIDDLLMEIAARGIVVFPGTYRMQFYKIQGIHKHFSSSREAMLRVVNIDHCRDIGDAWRRLHEQGILTLLPSAIYSEEDIVSLRNRGMHVIPFADNTSVISLLGLLKIVKPLHIYSVQKNAPPHLFEPYAPFLRNPVDTSIIASAQEFPPDRENLHKSLSITDESQERSASMAKLIQDLTHFDELTPESGFPDIFQKYNGREGIGIYTKDKNTDHLITDSQSSFLPQATSTQQHPPEPEISDDLSTVLYPSQQKSVQEEEIPASGTQMTQNIPTSQRNMNRFDEEYANDPLNHKNRLNRLHLVNIFGHNSMNRAASISKAKRTVEVSCQTDQPLGDIVLPENVVEEISPHREICEEGESLGTQTHISFIEPRRKTVAFNSMLNIVHELNETEESSDRVISSSEQSMEANESIIYPDMSCETIILDGSSTSARVPMLLSQSTIDEMEVREQAQNMSVDISHVQNNDEILQEADLVEAAEEELKTETMSQPCEATESQNSSVVIFVHNDPIPIAHVELTCSSMELQNILNSTVGSGHTIDPLMSSFEHIHNVVQCSPVTVEIPCEDNTNKEKGEFDFDKCSQASYYTRMSQINYDDALFLDDEEEEDGEENDSFITCVNTQTGKAVEKSTKKDDKNDSESINQEEREALLKVISPVGHSKTPAPGSNDSNDDESVVSESSVSTEGSHVSVHLISIEGNTEKSQIMHRRNEEIRIEEDMEDLETIIISQHQSPHREDFDNIIIDSNIPQHQSPHMENLQQPPSPQKPTSKGGLLQQSILQHFSTRKSVSEQERNSPQRKSSQEKSHSSPKRSGPYHSSLQALASLSLPSTSKGFCSEFESLSTIRTEYSRSSKTDSFKSLTVPCFVNLERLSDSTISEYQADDHLELTDRQKLRIEYNKQKSEELQKFAILELEPFQKPLIFTKKALQFMDDNFIEPKKLCLDLNRYRYANMMRNIDHAEKLEAKKKKNKGGKGRKKGG